MKKIISTALCTAMILGSVTAFADRSPEFSEKPEIKFLQEKGYLKGRGNGLELESYVTRAEALTMLLRVCDEENVAISGNEEAALDYELISGEFVNAEENGFVINTENGEVLVNTENAHLRGTSPEVAEKGNFVSAVVSKQRTRSIPAMVKGYVAVISDITSAKVIDVAEVEEEDGVYNIISADGEYIVIADENTLVTPFKSRNIMRVDDIDEGDRIVVLSDVMTMSIPAQLMPNEMIVMENSFEDFDDVDDVLEDLFDDDDDDDDDDKDFDDKKEKPEKLGKNKRKAKDFEDTKGHWAEKIIKYSYKNGYVDGESETHFNPEGKVKGREMVKMMLSKIGKKDITIENACEIAVECGLIDDDILEDVIENNSELTREDISRLCYKFIKITKPDVIENVEVTK